MRATKVALDMRVEHALSRWPELNAVLLRHQLACSGCAMAPFERLSDVARSYGLSAGRFLRELRAAIRSGSPATTTSTRRPA